MFLHLNIYIQITIKRNKKEVISRIAVTPSICIPETAVIQKPKPVQTTLTLFD